MYPFIFERGAAHHRDELHIADSGADCCTHFVGRDRIRVFEELLHEGFVVFCDGLEEFSAVLVYGFHQVGGDRDFLVGHSHIVLVPDDGFVRDKVYHAPEVFFRADGYLEWDCVGAQFRFHVVDDVEEIGT